MIAYNVIEKKIVYLIWLKFNFLTTQKKNLGK